MIIVQQAITALLVLSNQESVFPAITNRLQASLHA